MIIKLFKRILRYFPATFQSLKVSKFILFEASKKNFTTTKFENLQVISANMSKESKFDNQNFRGFTVILISRQWKFSLVYIFHYKKSLSESDTPKKLSRIVDLVSLMAYQTFSLSLIIPLAPTTTKTRLKHEKFILFAYVFFECFWNNSWIYSLLFTLDHYYQYCCLLFRTFIELKIW